MFAILHVVSRRLVEGACPCDPICESDLMDLPRDSRSQACRSAHPMHLSMLYNAMQGRLCVSALCHTH